MAQFRRLLLAALCAGTLAGVVGAAAQHFGTVPLILKAEAAEPGEPASAAWKPENGTERTAATLAADVLAGIGFALLLGAGLSLRGGEAAGWREGLLWGLAGFAALTLAPGIGLPPALPGTAAAPLVARQAWWLVTATATAGGIALIAFTRRPLGALAAVLLILLPQLYGAPPPAGHAAAASPAAALAQQFRVAATVSSFLFWVVLGASAGYCHRRFRPRPPRSLRHSAD